MRIAMLSAHTAPTDSALPRSVRMVVFAVGIDGPSLRYRAHLPAEALRLLGVECHVCHYRDPALRRLISSADATVFYRVPATVQVLDHIAAARDRSRPVFFDVDDLIFDPDLESEIPALRFMTSDEIELWREGVGRYRTAMEACDSFIGSTDTLCRHATAVSGMAAERFDNGVGLIIGRLSDDAITDLPQLSRKRIGYFSGTPTHDSDWASVESAVLAVLDRHRDAELWLGGHISGSDALNGYAGRVRRLPAVSWTHLPRLLRSVNVNLAPLELPSRFNEAKSAIKWLESALVAVPTIASASAPFRDAIVDGSTGLLAESPDDWENHIEWLLGDPIRATTMGSDARRDAYLRWSPHIQGTRYLEILERGLNDVSAHMSAGTRRRLSSSWVPVALNEPPLRLALEPYRSTAAGFEGSWFRRASLSLRRVATRGFRSVTQEGAATTARRCLDFGHRQIRTIAASARHRRDR